MAHQEQRDFCSRVKKKYPQYFKYKNILDVGSLDVNGSNIFLFEDCNYMGIDVGEGKNVDKVAFGHEFDAPDEFYDLIISTECFEHDMYYERTLQNIVRMLSPRGLFIFTCAHTGRPVHGTRSTEPTAAPLLHTDYYKNLTPQDINCAINIEEIFNEHLFEISKKDDLYFYGIKK